MRFYPTIGGPPHPQALRPEQTGTQRETRMGPDHGEAAAQDTDHLHRLSRQHPCWTTNRHLTQIVTGEPDDQETIKSGSAGGRWKRPCTTGTSPAAYPTQGRRETARSWHSCDRRQ